MKRFILLLITMMSLLVPKAWGQEIKGFVLDTDKQAIPYCNVVGYRADSTFIGGTITDDNGAYKLSQTKDLSYLKFSCIGYQNQIIPLAKLKTQTILVQTNTQLKEVTIKAERPKLALKGSALELSVKGTTLSFEQDIMGVLAKLPGLNATGEGELKLLKGGKLLILLNGREVHSLDEIKGLDVKSIKSVSLDNTPSVRYKNDVSAVLQIKTQKLLPNNLALMASFRLKGSHLKEKTNLSHDQQVQIGYATNKANYFADFTYAKYNENREQIFDTQIDLSSEGKGTYQVKSSLDTQSPRERIQLRLGADFTPNDKLSLGFKYNLRYDDELGFSAVDNTTVFHNKVLQKQLQSQLGGDKNLTLWHHINSFTEYKFNEKFNLTLNGDLVLKDVNTNQTSDITYLPLKTKDFIDIDTDTDYYLWQLTPVFAYKLPKGQLDFGGEVSQIKGETKQDYSKVLRNQYANKEKLYAGFANYRFNFSKFSTEVGLRYEYAKSLLDNKKTPAESIHRDYSNLFFVGKISGQVGKTFQNLSFKSSINRPPLSFLSNQTVELNPYLIQLSNPKLIPEKRYSLDYSLAYNWLYLSLNYTHVQNPFGFFLSPSKRTEGGYEVQHINYEKANHFQVVASINKTWDWYNLMLTGVYSYERLNGNKQGLNIKYKPMLYGQIVQWFTLPKGFRFGVDYSYHTAQTSGINELEAISYLNLHLTKSFLKDKLQVSLKANDIFDTLRNTSVTRLNKMISNMNMRFPSRSISLKLTYRFNKAKSYRGQNKAQKAIQRL